MELTSKLKIVRITTFLDFGGQEKQYISFTDKKEILKHEYIFAAIGYGGYSEKKLLERGFNVKIFDLPVSHKNLRNIFIIKNWLDEIKPDIVHTAASEANFHGIIAAKLAGIPIVIGEEIGIPSHSRIAKIVFRLIYKFVDKVIGVSNAVVEHLISIKEIPRNKGITIYNPVTKTENIVREIESEFQWVYVGRLVNVKNVKLLLNSFSKLPENKRGVLHIVGDGDEKENLERLSKKLDIQDVVIFHGFSEKPFKFLKKANAFILPSYSEGFGIAVVEAMFHGIPVICSNVGGIPEFINHSENGWLFDPNKSNELIDLMEKILFMDDKELSLMGQKGKEDVINKFTVEKYVSNIENLYERLYLSKKS